MGISVAQSCEAALSYYHKAAKKGTLLMLEARVIYTDPLHDTVVDKVTLITGGLLISKVRLMEEDNEVQMYGIGYCSRLCDLCACRPPMCTGCQRTT